MRQDLAVVIVSLALGTYGCVKTGSSSPTAPGTPTTRTLTFASDTSSPTGQSVGVTLTSRGEQPEMVALAVTGYNIANKLGGSQVGSGIWGVMGRVKWDGSQLMLDAVGAGDFLRQGGVEPQACTVEQTSAVIPGSTNGFCFQRDETTPRLFGTGELYYLRLKPMAGATSGTSRIDFVSISDRFPSLLVLSPVGSLQSNPRESPIEHYYGGTITIR